MKNSEDQKFNETLKRMMDSKPKPHEEMKKKGRGQKPAAKSDEKKNR